jgi:hypothetical protein
VQTAVFLRKSERGRFGTDKFATLRLDSAT